MLAGWPTDGLRERVARVTMEHKVQSCREIESNRRFEFVEDYEHA